LHPLWTQGGTWRKGKYVSDWKSGGDKKVRKNFKKVWSGNNKEIIFALPFERSGVENEAEKKDCKKVKIILVGSKKWLLLQPQSKRAGHKKKR